MVFHSAVEHLSTCRTCRCDCDPPLAWEDFAAATNQAHCHIQKVIRALMPTLRGLQRGSPSPWAESSAESSPPPVQRSWGSGRGLEVWGYCRRELWTPLPCALLSQPLSLFNLEAPLPRLPCVTSGSTPRLRGRRPCPPGDTQHVGSRSLLGVWALESLGPCWGPGPLSL